MVDIRRIIFSFIVSLLLCFSVAAQQEMLFPLHSNQTIKKYLKEHPKANTNDNPRLGSPSDTLPFIDDFSYDGVYPNPKLWSDSDVFINRDFAINPPTLGVATFDGADRYGNPYDSLSSADTICDRLTSQYINLNYPNDTTIWLSFFYQPQGRGDEPEIQDSLELQFENPADTSWITMWSVPGAPDTAFQQVMINIRDTAYNFLTESFRFRFINIANPMGADDQWNLDYVRLDKGRSATDTGFVSDGAFLYRNKALLIPPYTSMPYSHFKTNPTLFVVKSDTVLYKNLSAGHSINFANDFRIVIDDTIYYDSGVNALTVGPYSTVQNIKPLNGTSLPVTADSILKFATWNINDSRDSLPQNDTVREPQVLSNYYSYDDGTAEAAYGVYGAVPGSEADIALRFDLQMADTLRGVSIYWDQFGPNVHGYLLNIAVWNDLVPNTNDANLLYQIVDAQPENIDSLNGFATYIFDTPLFVSGTIYVGWSQIEEQNVLNVGFDRNTDTHTLLYYNVLYSWTQASDSGTVMIRPILGAPIPVSAAVNEIAKPDFTSSVFPNPAGNQLTVSSKQLAGIKVTIELYNVLGKKVYSSLPTANCQLPTVLDVSNIDDGFYLLKITDDKTSQFDTHKILVSH